MLLSEAQCVALASMLGYHSDWETISQRFKQKNINAFKVTELKTIIRYLKTQAPFVYNSNLRSSGVKADLVEGILAAVHGTGSNGSNRPAPPAASVQQNYSYHRPPAELGGTRISSKWGNGNYGASRPTDSKLQDMLMTNAYKKTGRTPFHKLISVLSSQMSTISSKYCRLQFSVSNQYLQRLGRTPGYPKTAAVHIRLFCPRRNIHVAMESSFGVCVNNNHWCRIPEPRKRSKTAKKAHEVVPALDISNVVSANNTVEVTLGPVGDTNGSWFQGIVTAELVEIVAINKILSEVKEREPIVNAETVFQELVCGFEHCGIKHDLLRCSRCKTRWYCGADHQRRDWDTHKISCKVPEVEPPPPQLPIVTGDDEEIMEMDTIVSLVCPLSIEKIEVPVRGRNCSHERCFDLETWLEFSEQTGLWQCPLCFNGCPFEDTVVDAKLQNILKEVEEDVNQVRLLPDGTYVPITEKVKDENPKRKRDKEYNPNGPSDKRPKTYDSDSDDSDSPHPPSNNTNNYHQYPPPHHQHGGPMYHTHPSHPSSQHHPPPPHHVPQGHPQHTTNPMMTQNHPRPPSSSSSYSYGSAPSIGALQPQNPFDSGGTIDDAIIID